MNESMNLVVEGQLVDGYLVLPGVALLRGREEGLREVEPGQPEHHGRPVRVPVLWSSNDYEYYSILTVPRS